MHGHQKVWRPRKSLASRSQDGCEEGGRGWSSAAAPEASCGKEQSALTESKRKRAKTPRSRVHVPTVVVRDPRPATVAANAKCADKCSDKATGGEECGGRDKSYATIERRSCRENVSLLDCDVQVGNHSEHAQQTDFCGWMESEALSKHALAKSTAGTNSKTDTSDHDRSTLYTPLDGHRSTMHSRAGSRYSSGRRREHYDFRHLVGVHEYMEHYRTFYCYTTLNAPPQLPCRSIHELEEETEEEKDAENFMPLGVKLLYLGDPYLRELVSRLGVRISLQSREQQLLKIPHPTPPSIMKKNKETPNLAVCSPGRREDECLGGNDDSGEDTYIENSRVSRPVSRSIHPNEASPLELPSIPHAQPPPSHPAIRPHKDKSNSVISIAKYLRVSATTQPSSDLLGEETKVGAESVHSLAEYISSVTCSTLTDEVLPELPEKERTSDVCSHQEEDLKKATFSRQEQLPLQDEYLKEKLLSQKAYNLGLLSWDWSKAPHMRRMINWGKSHEGGSQSYSRPVTRGGATGQSRSEQPRSNPQRKQEPTLFQRRDQISSHQSSKTSRSISVDNSKLERLKSIYSSSDKPSQEKRKESGSHGRLQSARPHKCESRLRSRPVTRLDGTLRSQKDGYGGGWNHSQPGTTPGRQLSSRGRPLPRATVKEVDMEEDCYWNELSRGGNMSQSRPTTRHGGSNSSEMGSRPVTRAGTLSRRQRNHSTKLTMRIRKPQRWEIFGENGVINEVIPPGSTPNQISAHSDKVQRKFDGILSIQQRKLIPTDH